MAFPNSEGKRVPEVTFRTRTNGQWKDVTTRELFGGKRVAVFSLPGAFTPTCSGSHVPRFNDLAPALRRQGIDSIVCLSVNDAFVMDAWSKDQHADNITFIPDGNGEFTQAMGLLVDKKNLGFGARSWRYSMVVKDGVIEKMFIEPEKEGDPFEVSDAETMLHWLAPDAKIPHEVVMFSKPGCSFCAKARELLKSKGMAFDEIESSQRRLLAVSGKKTTPQVFIDGQLIGGSDDLEKYLSAHAG